MKYGWLCTLCIFALHQSLLPGKTPAAFVADSSYTCSELGAADFSQVVDAPTQIIEASLKGPSPSRPEYCLARGYVTPNVGFVIGLPLNGWNGKLIELGCGGFCGSADNDSGECDELLRKGYACIFFDGGHESTALDAKWAYNNPQAEIDLGYRAAHVTSLAGKAIVGRYYGRTPKNSYFKGGSTGGRQAMMEAQYFPHDFQGIIAGCPSLDAPDIFTALLWGNRTLTGNNGQPVLTQPDLELLHKAVVAKCDMNDGIKDGLIGDPRACAFNTFSLACTPTSKPGECLSKNKLEAIEKIYNGPTTSRGERVYMPGGLMGSELTWLDSFLGPASDPAYIYKFVREAFSYTLLKPNPGPTWRPEEFDFDRDYQRLGLASVLYSATNPDLRRFKATGGKILMYAGWNDSGFMALPAVDYYETVEKTLGGRRATQDFFRLFMLPGVNHCVVGEGAFAVDYLSYLEKWVEKGQAPDRLISSHIRFEDLGADPNVPSRMPNAGDLQAIDQGKLRRRFENPVDPAIIGFSRPVYPYPTRTVYLGHGDPKDAASFGPSAASN